MENKIFKINNKFMIKTVQIISILTGMLFGMFLAYITQQGLYVFTMFPCAAMVCSWTIATKRFSDVKWATTAITSLSVLSVYIFYI